MESPWNGGDWSSRAFARNLGLFLIAFDLLIMALAGWTLLQAHHRYVQQAESIAQNLGHVLEQNLRGTVNQIDLGLLAIKDEFERQDMPQGKKRIDAHVQGQLARIPILNGIRLANAEGLVYQGSGLPRGRQVNLADRDYFQHHKNHPGAGLFISRPHFGRITGHWGLQLARRLNHPDGSFAGIVYGTITLDQLSRTFSQVDVGPHGSISLRGGDLSLLVRFPAQPGADRLFGDRTIAGDYLQSVRSNRPISHFTAPSVLDGTVRTYTLRRMTDPAFYILIGLSQQDYLHSWRQEALLSALAVSGLLALSLGIGWVVRTAWIRQARAQQERDQLIQELSRALAEVKQLKGMLPICGHCKKIRDDQGYWNNLEGYISEHTEATFSHGVCPDCAQELRREMQARREQREQER